jgi:hypothetical protein
METKRLAFRWIICSRKLAGLGRHRLSVDVEDRRDIGYILVNIEVLVELRVRSQVVVAIRGSAHYSMADPGRRDGEGAGERRDS